MGVGGETIEIKSEDKYKGKNTQLSKIKKSPGFG